MVSENTLIWKKSNIYTKTILSLYSNIKIYLKKIEFHFNDSLKKIDDNMGGGGDVQQVVGGGGDGGGGGGDG